MNRPLSRDVPQRQRGAMALLFGLTLVVLLAAGGLVLDLGHLYVLKSELQNGADAAALAGAKEIDMTTAGINKAAAKAIAYAGKNKFNFASDLVLTNAEVTFGSSPNGPFVSVGEAALNPSGKTFIRIETGNKTVTTYLMGVAGIPTMATSGVAVAGRFVVDITPIGLCAIDPVNRLGARATTPVPPAVAQLELLEHGFRRGMTYDMLQMGAIGGPADPMLLNPVDSPPTACAMSHSSANFTAPFLCQGNSAVTNNATEVYANTGVSTGPVEKSLNSRFNQYPGGSACLPSSAPPDRNIRDYPFGDTSNGPARYMVPDASAQSQPYNASSGFPQAATSAATVGVLWTYSRPLKASGTPGNYTAGAPFDTSEWSELYYNGAPRNAVTPGEYPAGATASPYAQTAGPYFEAPTVNPGSTNRRLMNLAIVNCSTATSNAMSCKRLPVVAVGRFFLQRPVQLNGPGKGLFVEFAGLIEPVPNSEIKLYR
ncbi:pilus assembly protein TadG-related protein [Massilia sp. CF038]|uniref:pilus assembly protein TadG-related protein n=1 Tax=Massilia sp. CF038 TaxID=1881045 RepID=UPI0009171207|nr:pilus assembly protein TadG-related protein [Massilia sp. CF038]SHG50447.1 Putative Flp pilus-assembly TadE/G-like [Massilia sp. CF038]